MLWWIDLNEISSRQNPRRSETNWAYIIRIFYEQQECFITCSFWIYKNVDFYSRARTRIKFYSHIVHFTSKQITHSVLNIGYNYYFLTQFHVHKCTRFKPDEYYTYLTKRKLLLENWNTLENTRTNFIFISILLSFLIMRYCVVHSWASHVVVNPTNATKL